MYEYLFWSVCIYSWHFLAIQHLSFHSYLCLLAQLTTYRIYCIRSFDVIFSQQKQLYYDRSAYLSIHPHTFVIVILGIYVTFCCVLFCYVLLGLSYLYSSLHSSLDLAPLSDSVFIAIQIKQFSILCLAQPLKQVLHVNKGCKHSSLAFHYPLSCGEAALQPAVTYIIWLETEVWNRHISTLIFTYGKATHTHTFFDSHFVLEISMSTIEMSGLYMPLRAIT